MPLPPLLFPFCVSRPPTPPPFPTRPHVLFVVMLLRLPQLLLPRCCCRRCCCRRCCCRRLTHVSIETVLTRAACVYAWFCMRVPTQPAPATRTTTDPWGSGSTVVISQVRDSDGFDLKGMGLCLSLCMHMLRACLLAYCSISPLAAAWTNQSAYSLRLSRACLVWTNPSAFSFRLSRACLFCCVFSRVRCA
jgi:hypothetical protein